jgi:drug/metabolite transporter (DMT)-like permease
MSWRKPTAFIAIGLLWGSAWIPNSLVTPQIPGLRAGTLRFATAALLVAVLAVATRLRRPARSIQPILIPSLVLGVAMIALPYAAATWAAGQVSSGLYATLFAFMPLGVLLLEGDNMGKAIPAIVIGIGGIALLVAPGLSTSTGQLKGTLSVVVAVASGAYSLHYARKHLGHHDLRVSVAIQFAVAAVALGALSVATEHNHPTSWNGQAALSLLILAIAVSGTTLPLLYWLLRKLEAWQAATLQWIATLVAVAESAWLLHVRPYAESWIGAAMIVGATVWLLSQSTGDTPVAVTLEITNHTFRISEASESEVGSKVD